MKDVVFVIPVFNEGAVIRRVVAQVLAAGYAVVCVDDGSSDNSTSEIEATDAYLVQHPINMGQGAALQTGVEFARKLPGVKHFVTYDADGQHRLEDVKTMIETLNKNKLDIVLGSRFLGEAKNITFQKKMILKMAIIFSNITSGLKLTDTHNGLRVFTSKVANDMQITMPDMAHASEILEFIALKKYAYAEVPVTIEYTDYSRSKGQSTLNAINIAFDMLLRKLK